MKVNEKAAGSLTSPKKSLLTFLQQLPVLTIEDRWVSTDLRPERGSEQWLNTISSETEIIIPDGHTPIAADRYLKSH